MRRISVFVAFAAILLSASVAYTLKLRIANAKKAHTAPAPHINPAYEAVSPSGWDYTKSDPQTNKPVVKVHAQSAQATHDPSTVEIHALALRLYDKNASAYTYVKCDKALFDERSGLLKSQGPVTIVMNVAADKDAEDPTELSKRVRVQTTGIDYETKTGKAVTNQFASFVFPKGDGQAVGAEYDPNTKTLHLKSQISLNWVGDGPAENKMHIEAGDLVYKEAEQKIYLSPWSKLQRQSTTIQARNSTVLLQDQRLHEIDGDGPAGQDDRENRHTEYAADSMKALFDDDGNLVNIIGNGNAKVVSTQPGSKTTLSGNQADLRFAVTSKEVAGKVQCSSDLHLVTADGHAVAESEPAGNQSGPLPETRILRSERIELDMKPGGKDIQEIRTSSQAQLEFKPNRSDQSHRLVDASRLRVLYGNGSYVDTFLAWNVATHTDKPASQTASKTIKTNAGRAQQPAPALTWSDQMTTRFVQNTNQVATIEQTGNFRYAEGLRRASAKKAFLEQTINRITLTGTARVLDDTGSALADEIVMNQANGDMDAIGHVVSTRKPDSNQKPGTSMLDATKAMQAQADQMQTREENAKINYDGRAVMWQGANRIAAEHIYIDRDKQILQAHGHVVSELVDNKDTDDAKPAAPASAQASQAPKEPASPPVFTIVQAGELLYHDDTRLARYSGGVKLLREKMVVTAKEVLAYLTPKTDSNGQESSLDHAFANGDVTIFETIAANRTRTGTADHCEYYTKENKVILNGGSPQMVDSYKGVTKGRELTYYDDDDRLLVVGEKKTPAYTQMKTK